MGAIKVAALLGMALLASATPPRDPQLKHARAINAFGVSLLKELRSANEDANIFFSPVSISLALGLIYAGARGTSQSELSSVLGFSDADLVERDSVMAAYKSLVETSTPNVTFDIANTILIKKGGQILDQYKQDLADYFQASARSVDFVRDGARATEEVNEWVRAKTKGKISSLLGGSLPMNTMAFLLNAVYFKGTWVTKFRAGETKLLPFYNYGREEVKVRTMSLHGVLKCAILDELRAKAVAIPYAGNRFSMVVVLPWSKTQLPALESALSVDTIDKIISALAARQVHLLLPKFQLGTDYNLLPTLRKLGLESVFKSEAADLSGISGENGLSVSDVKHKAMVEVNEEGTVAAAVTSVRVRPRGNTRSLAVPLVLNFHVEHPFAFIIWDNASKRAVFIGAVKKL